MIKMFLYGFCLFGLVFSSCAKNSLRDRPSESRLSKKHRDGEKITEARILYERGDIDAAISRLSTWVDTVPYESSHDHAYELIVEWLLQLNRQDEAKRVASYFLSRYPKSKSADRIIELFDKPIILKPQTNEPHSPVPEQMPEDKDGGNSMDSVMEQETTSVYVPIEEQENYLLYDAPISEVTKLATTNGGKASLAHARLAMHHFHLGDFERSSTHVNHALENLSGKVHDMMATLKKEIDAIVNVDMKSLGVILPLTGSFAPFGKKVLTAMGIAWALPLNGNEPGVKTITKNDVKIYLVDSQGDALKAADAVEQLVKTHNVAMIVGDITNDPSLLAAQKCQQYGVPMLSMSRHPVVANLGKFVFVFNASFRQQIEHLVNHAMNIEGHKRFAILFPRHNYGMSMSRMFFDEIIKRGGIIAGIEAYDTHETTFFEPVKKLVGKYYVGQRMDLATCKRIHRTDYEQKCQNVVKPTVDFDALFIPEFPKKLAMVIPALMQEDLLITNSPRAKASLSVAAKIDNPPFIQLLGANSWNDKTIFDKIASHIDGAYFVDSMSFEESEEVKQFVTSFSTLNGEPPTTLEVFAHDAAIFAVKLLSDKGVGTRKDLREKMANFNGKIGLLKQVAFKETGELDAPELGFSVVNGGVRQFLPTAAN